MKLYTLDEIKEHKKAFSEKSKEKYFLKHHPYYVPSLEKIFGYVSHIELNYLINNDRK